MNRSERRALKKKMKGQNLIVNPGIESIDRTNNHFCWRHNLKLDNIDKPSERDKKIIETVRLKPFKIIEKDGAVTLGRKCGRCGNTLFIKNTLLDPSKNSIIVEPQENEYNELRT